MQPAAILSVLVTANTAGASRNLLRFNATMKATEHQSNKALGAVTTFAKGAGIGIGAALAYSVKKAADFEQQMSSLGAVTEANARQMEKFKKQAMAAGAATKFSALDAAKAQTELAKGGLSVRNILRGGLRSALALAAAGELELSDAAATTANAMNLFGIRGKDSIKVADALAKAANATTADVSDFAMALNQGGSVAKAAGLNFTETVLALEALAKSGIKNSDAGTSLKTALIQLIKPTEKQAALADKLNISFLDQEGRFKNLSDISDMLRRRTEGMTKAQRTATFATLAGTDGVRTLTSIYNAGSPKLDKWRRGLEESGTAADVAKKKQANFKGVLENLQGSVETLAISFGLKLLPALTDAAKQITKVLNDKSLTSAEKFNKLGQMLGKAIGNAGPSIAKAMAGLAVIGVQAFFTAFRNSPLWIKLLTAGFILNKLGGFSAFRQVGTKAGVAMADGIGTGVATSAKSGRFAKAAGAFKTIGRNVLGVALVAGIADAASRQGISGFGDRFQQFASTATFNLIPAPRDIDQRLATITDKIRTWRQGVLKLSDTADPDNSLIRAKDLGDFSGRQKKMLKGLLDLRNTATHLFGPNFKISPKMEINPEAAIGKLRKLANEFGRLKSGAVLDVRELRKVTETNARLISETLGSNTKQGMQALTKNFRLGLRTIFDFKRRGVLTVDQTGHEIARLLRVHSGAGKDALAKNLFLAYKATERMMDKSVKVTDKGAGIVRKIFVQQLKLYGISAESIRFRLEGKEQSGKTIGAPLVGKQRGGPISHGKAAGDSVPAMLERGEYVLNRNAVRKVGKDRLDSLNFGAAKRFQAGGLAGMVGAANRLDKAHFPYVWGGGHQGSPAPFGPMDCSGAVSYVLQHGGVQIPTMVSGALAGAGQPGPGRVTVFANAGHTFMRIGNRYFGTSGSNPGGGAGWFPDPGSSYRAGFAQRHFRAGGGGLGIPKLTVTGPDSALRSTIQGAVSGLRTAANMKLRDLAASSMGGGDAGDPGPFSGGGNASQNRQLGIQMAKARGWGGGQFRALDKLWTGESGWRTTADNPTSDAYGIPQALPGSKMASAGADWATNPATQIKWGLDYIAGRYGDPRNAYAQWLARSPHWYQRGGMVGHLGALGAGHGAGWSPDPKKGGGTGDLGKMLRKTLKVLRTSPKAKLRGKRLRKFEDRVRKMGLPKGFSDKLTMLSTSAETYGDYADKASQLNVENDDGTTTLGSFRSGTEQSWLLKQLDALFKWRNKIVDAAKVVEKRREQVRRLIVQAQKRLAFVKDRIGFAVKSQRGLRKTLKELQKHPKQNKDKIAAVKANIKHGDDWLKGTTRERRLLGERILPGLAGRRTALGEQYDNLTGSDGLIGVQGPGGSLRHLKTLPSLGVLGGSIFDVQLRLRDLSAPKLATTDNTPATDESTQETLRELLRQANLRTAVSEKQFEVLRNVPFTGAFAKGGVALVGEQGPELAHLPSGTRVHSAGDTERMMRPQIVVNGDIVNVPRGKEPVEVRYGRHFDRAVGRSRVNRRSEPLPGRGGG